MDRPQRATQYAPRLQHQYRQQITRPRPKRNRLALFPKTSLPPIRPKQSSPTPSKNTVRSLSFYGQTSDEKVKIIDLRFPKGEALDFAASSGNVFPGYHMNKNNWITIILDGNMPTPEILNLLDQSYRISLAK